MEGEELKHKRDVIGMTQVQLAESLGVKPNTVARYERGILAIPQAVALAIETIERNEKGRLPKAKPEATSITNGATKRTTTKAAKKGGKK